VLDLLMADENNPRSLAFQLADLGEHFNHLPRQKSQALDREEKIIRESLDRIRQSDIYALCQADADHFRPRLAELLGAVATMLPSVSNAITHGYFSLAQTSQQLASMQAGPTS
jgi:uncharacterized alpha-E superfamily protein